MTPVWTGFHAPALAIDIVSNSLIILRRKSVADLNLSWFLWLSAITDDTRSNHWLTTFRNQAVVSRSALWFSFWTRYSKPALLEWLKKLMAFETFNLSKWLGVNVFSVKPGESFSNMFCFWNSSSSHRWWTVTMFVVRLFSVTAHSDRTMLFLLTMAAFKFLITCGASARKYTFVSGKFGCWILLTVLQNLPHESPKLFHIARLQAPISLVTVTNRKPISDACLSILMIMSFNADPYTEFDVK